MLPKWHILFGFVFSYILIYFFDFSLIEGIIIFLSSVFIDIDHLIRYVINEKNYNPIKFWKTSMEKTKKWRKLSQKQKAKYEMPQFIFHGIEFWLFIALLSLVNQTFLLILLGSFIHMIFDFSEMIYHKEPLYAKISQIYTWQRNKNKKHFD